MQAAIALRKLSMTSVAIVVALVLALTAAGIGGYVLKSQLPSNIRTSAPGTVVGQHPQVAPFHDMPETVQQAAPFHDMPESR